MSYNTRYLKRHEWNKLYSYLYDTSLPITIITFTNKKLLYAEWKPTNDKKIEQAHISYASSGTYNMYVLIFVWFQYHSAFSVMPPQTKIFLLLKYRYFNFQREICGQLANKPHYNYFVTEHRVHTNFTIRVYVVAGNIPKVYVIWGSNLIWS